MPTEHEDEQGVGAREEVAAAAQSSSPGGPNGGPIGYRYAEQMQPPPIERVSEVAITRFEHVFEVDPRLMERWVLQQTFPNWDTLRIMHSRHDHLDWIHRHFATTVVPGSEILAELDAEAARNVDATDHPTQATTNPTQGAHP